MIDIYPEPYGGIFHPLEVEYETMFKNTGLEEKYQEHNKQILSKCIISRRGWFQWNIAKCHASWRDEFNRNFIVPEQELFPISSKNVAIRSIQLFEQNKQYVSESEQVAIESKLHKAKLKYDLLDQDLI